ncbi:hypothetical protein ACFVR2_21535 [Gottfriedia sp. NPDC057991]|uniref:hypothetical protein n=1 Tax=Gottfriedia sp. NPDC057991 TaxID=3346298 RepID=UPI0036DD464B
MGLAFCYTDKVWAPTPDMPAGKYKVTCVMEDETGLKISAKERYMTVVKPTYSIV